MEEYIAYLLYLVVLLTIGIMITAICNKLRFSNILFLVLAGYFLQVMRFNFFNDEIVLVLSSLALILIVLETTMDVDLSHIIKNFLQVLKFNVVYLIISSYIITLAVYLLFDIPGKGFEIFVLCFLLSIIIYGVDPIITMEFFNTKKNEIMEMLEIEGIISGPVVVVFAFFVINYLQSSVGPITTGIMMPLVLILKQAGVALALGLILAYLLHKFLQSFNLSKELYALLVITVGIAVFVVGEIIGTNGSLAVAIYGLFLRGLTKETMSKTYTSMVAHILFIIVFILFGLEFFFPNWIFWLKGLGLFVAYLVLRFLCIYLFMKRLTWREKYFMTLNVAKGIEVAIVLFIMKLHFSNIEGIDLILSIGFMFFILSYILSTIVNHFSSFFLDYKPTRSTSRRK